MTTYYHGSQSRNLPLGSIIVPQAECGVKGWTLNPNSPDRNKVFITDSLNLAMSYAFPRSIREAKAMGLGEWYKEIPNWHIRCKGGVYQVGPLSLVAVDEYPAQEITGHQFTCERAVILRDLSHVIWNFNEDIQ